MSFNPDYVLRCSLRPLRSGESFILYRLSDDRPVIYETVPNFLTEEEIADLPLSSKESLTLSRLVENWAVVHEFVIQNIGEITPELDPLLLSLDRLYGFFNSLGERSVEFKVCRKARGW